MGTRGLSGAPYKKSQPKGYGGHGGQLCQFAERWQGMTEYKWLLDTLATGYRVEFTGLCWLFRCPVWTRVPGFFSTLFLTEKKSGEWRPILNLNPYHAILFFCDLLPTTVLI